MKTKLRKFMNVAMAFLMLAGFNSCKKEYFYFYSDNEAGTFDIQGPDGKTLQNNSITLADGENLTITFEPSKKEYQNKKFNFKISCPKLEEVEGQPGLFVAKKGLLNIGNNTITVSASCIESFEDDNDEYNYNLSATKVFTLILTDNASLKVTPDNLELAATGSQHAAVSVESNNQWNVTTNASWLKVSKSTGYGNGQFEVYADDNTTGSARTGIVTVSASGLQQEIQVKQESKSNIMFEAPYTEWGTSRSTVKTTMSNRGYNLVSESNSAEDYYHLGYAGKYQESASMYMFDNSQKLYQVAIMLPGSVATLAQVGDYLTSKLDYTYLTDLNGQKGYVSSDYKTMVIVSSSTSNNQPTIIVLFTDVTNPTPDDDLFEAPYTEWGASRSTVKSTMSNRGYTLASESNSASDNYYLAYNGKLREMTSMYMFDSSQKLYQVGLIILESVANLSAVGEYLTSKLGYTYLTEVEGAYSYVSKDYATIVLISKQALDGSNVIVATFADFGSLVGVKQMTKAEQAKKLARQIREQQTPAMTEKALQQYMTSKFSQLQKIVRSVNPLFK